MGTILNTVCKEIVDEIFFAIDVRIGIDLR